jgi:hypothetical protein
MRTALLTTALMVVAVAAWADEPTPADPQAQPAAEAAPAKPDEKTAATDQRTVMIDVQDEEADKPFKPPTGYRPKRINGEQVYCTKIAVLGSRFPKEDCRNEAELRELIRNRDIQKNDVDRTRAVCSSNNGACGLN